jgi:hypothetical protein
MKKLISTMLISSMLLVTMSPLLAAQFPQSVVPSYSCFQETVKDHADYNKVLTQLGIVLNEVSTTSLKKKKNYLIV